MTRFGAAGHVALIAAMLGALTQGSAARAQQQPPAVPQVPTREEVEQPGGPPTRDATPAPSRLRVEDQVERAPCPLAEPAYANVRVTFSSVDFRNLKAIPADELRPAWAEFADREVPVATLCEVRDRAATILRRQGYVAAVQVPPQRIEKSGVVQLDVLLAKLAGIRVRGRAGKSETLIAAHLNKLVEQPYFNSFTAERHLLLAGDLPGYDVRLVLRPAGTVPGEVIGDVEVRRMPIDLSASAQNYGSRSIGRVGGLVQLRVNDLLGLGDTSRLSLFNTAQTREQTVLQLGHELSLGTSGLRLGGDFVYAWSKPDVANRAFSARTLSAGLDLSYPIIRKRQLTLRGTSGLDWVDQALDFGAARLSADHLRVAYLRADLEMIDLQSLSGALGYSAMEPKWAFTGGIELRRGLGGLGASPDCRFNVAACRVPNLATSRPEANPQALVVRAEASIDYRPAPQWTLSLAPRFQLSNDPLFGYEQYSAGNYTIGRAFDPGTIQGDAGAGFAFELRHGKAGPHSASDLTLQPYAFYDSAWVRNKGLTAGYKSAHLHSAGAGLRALWGSHGRADLTLAVPLDKAGFQTERGDLRLLFSISTQLYPW